MSRPVGYHAKRDSKFEFGSLQRRVYKPSVPSGGARGDIAASTSFGPDWHIITTGDFNGDRYSEILWQSNDGTIAIWEMNGSNVTSAAGRRSRVDGQRQQFLLALIEFKSEGRRRNGRVINP